MEIAPPGGASRPYWSGARRPSSSKRLRGSYGAFETGENVGKIQFHESGGLAQRGGEKPTRRPGEGVKESAAIGWRLGCGVTDHDLRRPGEGVKESAAMGWRLGLRRYGSRFAQGWRRREKIGNDGLAPWLRRNGSRFAQGWRRRERIGGDGLAPWLRRNGSRFAQARRPTPPGWRLGCGVTDHDLRRPGGLRHLEAFVKVAGQAGGLSYRVRVTFCRVRGRSGFRPLIAARWAENS